MFVYYNSVCNSYKTTSWYINIVFDKNVVFGERFNQLIGKLKLVYYHKRMYVGRLVNHGYS